MNGNLTMNFAIRIRLSVCDDAFMKVAIRVFAIKLVLIYSIAVSVFGISCPPNIWSLLYLTIVDVQGLSQLVGVMVCFFRKSCTSGCPTLIVHDLMCSQRHNLICLWPAPSTTYSSPIWYIHNSICLWLNLSTTYLSVIWYIYNSIVRDLIRPQLIRPRLDLSTTKICPWPNLFITYSSITQFGHSPIHPQPNLTCI